MHPARWNASFSLVAAIRVWSLASQTNHLVSVRWIALELFAQ
jgi:hypothetical protein